jgi:transcription initiation factor TFIIA large subunit
MAASTTNQVYIDVIEDVMVKVRDEFVNTGAGPGDEVLRELQAVNFTISSFSLFLLNFQLIN